MDRQNYLYLIADTYFETKNPVASEPAEPVFHIQEKLFKQILIRKQKVAERDDFITKEEFVLQCELAVDHLKEYVGMQSFLEINRLHEEKESIRKFWFDENGRIQDIPPLVVEQSISLIQKQIDDFDEYAFLVDLSGLSIIMQGKLCTYDIEFLEKIFSNFDIDNNQVKNLKIDPLLLPQVTKDENKIKDFEIKKGISQTDVRNTIRLNIQIQYEVGLESFLQTNHLADEIFYINYIDKNQKRKLKELEKEVSFFDMSGGGEITDEIADEWYNEKITRDHYWYYKEYQAFLMERLAELEKKKNPNYNVFDFNTMNEDAKGYLKNETDEKGIVWHWIDTPIFKPSDFKTMLEEWYQRRSEFIIKDDVSKEIEIEFIKEEISEIENIKKSKPTYDCFKLSFAERKTNWFLDETLQEFERYFTKYRDYKYFEFKKEFLNIKLDEIQVSGFKQTQFDKPQQIHRNLELELFDRFDKLRFGECNNYDITKFIKELSNNYEIDLLESLAKDIELYLFIKIDEKESEFSIEDVDRAIEERIANGLEIPYHKPRPISELTEKQLVIRKRIEKQHPFPSLPHLNKEQLLFPYEFYNIYSLQNAIRTKIIELKPYQPRRRLKQAKTVLDYVNNVKDKEIFLENLKATFSTEKGKSIKVIIALLEKEDILIIGGREFKAFYIEFKNYFDRDIGTRQSINDVKYEDIHDAVIRPIEKKLNTLIIKHKKK